MAPTSARSACDHCNAALETGNFACNSCSTTYCPFCDRASSETCEHLIVSLGGAGGLTWDRKQVQGPWLPEAAGRRLTTEEEEGVFGEALPLLKAYSGDLSHPPNLRRLIELALGCVDVPLVRVDWKPGSDYYALAPEAAYSQLERLLERLYAAFNQLKHLLTRPSERDRAVEDRGTCVRSRFFSYRQTVYVPRDLYLCHECGEYNGTVEPLLLGDIGLELELRCVCRGIPCPGCGVARMHRPASFCVTGDGIGYWPTVARLAVCRGCSEKRKACASSIETVATEAD